MRELLACSAALRPKHLDAIFLHRRRTRSGAGRASQQWYVGLDDWVAGTAADAAAAPAFFEMQVRGPSLVQACCGMESNHDQCACCVNEHFSSVHAAGACMNACMRVAAL